MAFIPKTSFLLDQVRRYLERGPVVLVSSFADGKSNIMTMGWHCILEFSPSLIGADGTIRALLAAVQPTWRMEWSGSRWYLQECLKFAGRSA